MIPIVVMIVLAIYTWRTATNTGRRPWVWLLAVLGVGIGVMWVLPMIVGVVAAIVLLAKGETPEQMTRDIGEWSTLLGLVFLVLGLASMGYIAKRAGVVPDEPAFQPPPPPPTFGDNA